MLDEPGGSLWGQAAQSPYRLHAPSQERAVRHVLWLCRNALAADTEGRHRSADFYWRDVMLRCAPLTRSPQVLARALRTIASSQTQLDADDGTLASRFVDEVLIDSLVASHNTHVASADAGASARAHTQLGRISQLLSLSRMSPTDRAATIRPAATLTAGAAEKAQRWGDAAAQYRSIFTADPSDVTALDGLVRSLCLQGKSAAAHQHACLLELNQLLDRMPMHAITYDAVADLSLERSIWLANNDQLPQALELVEHSLAANARDDALQIKAKLLELLPALQASAQQLQEEVKKRVNVHLTAQGRSIVEQARLGNSLAAAYQKSAGAAARRDNGHRARLRRFWLQLGLAEPLADWDEQVDRLIAALEAVLSAGPTSQQEIRHLWALRAARDELLAGLPAEPIVAFLAHRAMGSEWHPAQRPESQPSHDLQTFTVDPPRPAKSRDRIPIHEWLFSRQDHGLKVQAAAAAVLVAVATGFVIGEYRLVRERDAAVQVLQQSLNAHDYGAAMHAAEAFLAARKFCPDAREWQVTEAYRVALVRWMSELSGDFGPAEQAMVDRYRQLVVDAG
jgi:hypothetical protein